MAIADGLVNDTVCPSAGVSSHNNARHAKIAVVCAKSGKVDTDVRPTRWQKPKECEIVYIIINKLLRNEYGEAALCSFKIFVNAPNNQLDQGHSQSHEDTPASAGLVLLTHRGPCVHRDRSQPIILSNTD